MVIIVENQLTYQEYLCLRKEENFQHYKESDFDIAMKNNLYAITIKDNGIAIGMGRVVGDGRICFFIKDIIVKKEYQSKGIGKMIMNNILNYIQCNACHHAYVGLMATKNSVLFYEKFGFIQRPNKEMGPGMILLIEEED